MKARTIGIVATLGLAALVGGCKEEPKYTYACGPGYVMPERGGDFNTYVQSNNAELVMTLFVGDKERRTLTLHENGLIPEQICEQMEYVRETFNEGKVEKRIIIKDKGCDNSIDYYFEGFTYAGAWFSECNSVKGILECRTKDSITGKIHPDEYLAENAREEFSKQLGLFDSAFDIEQQKDAWVHRLGSLLEF